MKKQDTAKSIMRNLTLITVGAFILASGIKAVAVPHGFITGGMSGLSLLLFYASERLSPGGWYFLINIPVFALGWWLVSRRFFFYSLYGMLVLTAVMDLVAFAVPVKDPILAVLCAGTLVGAGSGIIFHSLGSVGGTDILAVLFNQKLNFPIGRFFFVFNLGLFSFGFGFLEVDSVLYSLAISYIASQVTDYFLSIFNQRKMVMVVSERSEAIAEAILHQLNRGATLLDGMGAYTRQPKRILMTVVNNYQIKRLEETVFAVDPDAFFIAENTFSVIGKGFSHRKTY